MRSNNIPLIALAAAAGLIVAGTGCQKLKARDNLNKGVQAFKTAKYQDAVEYFKRAVELDPQFPTARLYLASAYMSQYIPGAESAENLKVAQEAHNEFQRVLELDPNNSLAMASIATLYFHQKKFDDAEEWYKKLVQVDPQNKEAYYTMGVIAWSRTFQKRMEARAKLGMKPEDPGPIKDRKVREELQQANLEIINEGISYLEQALKIDPEYDDAMAYLNLLHRERADLQDTVEAYKKDIDTADEWVSKTLETKKIKAARTPAGATGIVSE
jgi:tetratricopeptide (TPR) repeat protein